jgi:hypothetical protein
MQSHASASTPTSRKKRVEDFATELTAKLNKCLGTVERAEHDKET